jgi:hypothetical protein
VRDSSSVAPSRVPWLRFQFPYPRLTLTVYSIVFMVPPAVLFIHSAKASAAFLAIIFSVSAWNGATFYVEVFGRK